MNGSKVLLHYSLFIVVVVVVVAHYEFPISLFKLFYFPISAYITSEEWCSFTENVPAHFSYLVPSVLIALFTLEEGSNEN